MRPSKLFKRGIAAHASQGVSDHEIALVDMYWTECPCPTCKGTHAFVAERELFQDLVVSGCELIDVGHDVTSGPQFISAEAVLEAAADENELAHSLMMLIENNMVDIGCLKITALLQAVAKSDGFCAVLAEELQHGIPRRLF